MLYYTAVLSKTRITAFFIKMEMDVYPSCNLCTIIVVYLFTAFSTNYKVNK